VIQPDYAKSVVCIYEDFARQHLELGNTSFLYYTGLWLRKQGSTDNTSITDIIEGHSLPSWAQEHRRYKLTGAELSWYPDEYTRFDVCKDTLMKVKQSPNISHKIMIMGRIFTLVENTLFVKDPRTIAKNILTLCNMMKACKNLCDSWPKVNAAYSGSEDLTMAFARKIVADGTAPDTKDARKPWQSYSPEMALEVWNLFEKECLDEQSEIYQKLRQIYPPDVPLAKWVDLSSSVDIPELYRPEQQRVWDYCRKLAKIFFTCQFITAETGHIGLAPTGTRDKYVIVIFDGVVTSFILRQVQASADYELIGPCYLHGIMYGEATPGLHDGGKGSGWLTLCNRISPIWPFQNIDPVIVVS
jgi:hypothetical protein